MKTALILGGNSELGLEIVKEFLKNNYLVITTIRDLDKIKFTDKNLKYFELDLLLKDSMDLFLKEIEVFEFDFMTSAISSKLILNKFEKFNLDIFREDYEVNVLNHIYLIQKLIPFMKKDSNILLILSEMVCNLEGKFVSSYKISKFALLGLMNVLSTEVTKFRTNSISPGLMETKFTNCFPKFVKDGYLKNSKKESLIKTNDVAKKIYEINNDRSLNGENIEFF